MKHTQLIAKVHIVRLKLMTRGPANQHVLGTETTKFGLGGIWADGGTINYGGGISNPHRNHDAVYGGDDKKLCQNVPEFCIFVSVKI